MSTHKKCTKFYFITNSSVTYSQSLALLKKVKKGEMRSQHCQLAFIDLASYITKDL